MKIQIHKAKTVRTDTATLEEIRSVWMLISHNPRITLRALVRITGMPRTRIHYITSFLERARYVKHQKNCTGRKVVIPFVYVER